MGRNFASPQLDNNHQKFQRLIERENSEPKEDLRYQWL